jgi:hypothetical protein
VYTWPNASAEDPGASAYTIDVASGAITPYLLTEERAKYTKMMTKWNEAIYTYNNSQTACDHLAREYPAGKYLHSGKDHAPDFIVLGYDCEKNVYVVVKREKLFPGTNSEVLVSRPVERTAAQLNESQYLVTESKYHVCPACNGYPAGFVTEYYSGWSDWEQKSLNIYLYTRKWETTKSEMLKLCQRCKGEAWVRD